MKNRMIAWVSGVVLVVVTLMVIIVKLEPPRDGIIRAQAMKAMALALTDKEECEKRAEERGTSGPGAYTGFPGLSPGISYIRGGCIHGRPGVRQAEASGRFHQK